jgi:hypothetical protein
VLAVMALRGTDGNARRMSRALTLRAPAR